MAVYFHEEDLPEGLDFGTRAIAVDTEAMGLMPGRDRLCLVQLSDGTGDEQQGETAIHEEPPKR